MDMNKIVTDLYTALYEKNKIVYMKEAVKHIREGNNLINVPDLFKLTNKD